MSSRVDWVDYAKAIGIILVVYGHVARGLYNAGMAMPESTYRLADSIVYSFHMPLFFFLSGLFFYHSLSKRGAKKLIFNKVDTIVYPYLLWSLLQGGVELVLSNYTNGNVTITEVLSVWEPRAQFWFLYALFLVVVVSTAIYSFITEKMSLVILLLASLLYINSSILPDLPFLGFVCNNLIFFVLGVAFTKYNFYDLLSSPAALALTLLSFIAAQYVFHVYLDKVYTQTGIESLILALLSIFFIVSASIAISRKPNQFLAYLGTSSMAIYLMHILLGSGARVILSKVFAVESAAIHLIIGSLVGLLLPLVACKIITAINIPYVFAAPVSKGLKFSYK